MSSTVHRVADLLGGAAIVAVDPPRVAGADWHLFDTDTPVVVSGGSLSAGHRFDADGALVASAVLDAVMRIGR